MELIRTFSPDVLDAALANWAWLPDLAGKKPLWTSRFGDVFLEGEDGVWFLDTVDGRLTREWDSVAAAEESLRSLRGQDEFLFLGLALDAEAAGLRPGDHEVLSFVVPPALGGALEPANLEVSDVQVALSVAGQVHRQVKDLAPGTRSAGVPLDDEQHRG